MSSVLESTQLCDKSHTALLRQKLTSQNSLRILWKFIENYRTVELRAGNRREILIYCEDWRNYNGLLLLAQSLLFSLPLTRQIDQSTIAASFSQDSP